VKVAEEMVFAEREKDSKVYTAMQEILDDKTAALAFIAPYALLNVRRNRAVGLKEKEGLKRGDWKWVAGL